MQASLVYSKALNAYDLGPGHALRPERVEGAVAMMRAHDLLGAEGLHVIEPRPASREDLERVHSPRYIDAVIRASAPGAPDDFTHGIGAGDTPVFPEMHAATALVAGGSIEAMRSVLDGRDTRSLAIAGGLHHAHRDRAAGFCVYNDPAIAIAWALEREPKARIAYIDIDAHHGDGVQEAFWNEPRVLTISLHESGRYLFPGTGFPDERGGLRAPDSAANVPMPQYATDACYDLAFDAVVAPLVSRFRPDLVVSQNGADALHSDPLTSLGLTLGGYRMLVERISALSHRLCAGRLVALGGGGYDWQEMVPRAWTLLAASLLGREMPASLAEDTGPALREGAEAVLLRRTREVVGEVMRDREL